MKIWLRIAAILQALGTVGHTMASQKPVSRGPGEEAAFSAMRSFHFDIMGATRSHWDFYKGYELSISVAFGVLAVLIWQLSSMSMADNGQARPLIVTILVCEILFGIIGWIYFFAAPGTVSILIALCLAIALAAGKQTKPA